MTEHNQYLNIPLGMEVAQRIINYLYTVYTIFTFYTV